MGNAAPGGGAPSDNTTILKRLIERGVLMDASYDELLAQTSRRTTVLTMEPYLLKTESQRRDWRTLLTTIEQRLVLGDKRIGMLAEDLSDYLYERSTGHIGSLMDLIRRGCVRAIRTGKETLNRQLLDTIKIDRTFVQEIGTNPDSLAIVRAVSGMCGSLGIATTAEGVETAEQMRILTDEKCDSVQGFLFSEPVPLSQTHAMFQGGRGARAA